MKVLRLKLFQETACYKKPHAFKVAETYPLPPFATVKGMIHSVLQANSLIPMGLCIQGNYEALVSDYQTHYFFKKNKTSEFPLTIDGLTFEREFTDITTMPIYIHLLYNVNLTIYIKAKEKVLHDLYKALHELTTHACLGRWEDLVRIDECEIISLEETDEETELTMNAFVPKPFIPYKTKHMPYRLNWVYRIVQGTRVWDKIDVGYMKAGQILVAGAEELYVDQEGIPVFFHQ